MIKQKLMIEELANQDGWKDMARVPKLYRLDTKGKAIGHNKICKVIINDMTKLLAVRGCGSSDAKILLDLTTREFFHIKSQQVCDVELHPAGWIGYCKWAWNAADPAYRVPAQLSLISLALGLLGFILGVVGIVVPLIK